MARGTRIPENTAGDYPNCTAISDLENDEITRRTLRNRTERRARRLGSSLKSRLIHCCSFTYKNNSQLAAATCFLLILLFGIIKIIFGANSVANGKVATFLVKQERLLWAGLFLLLIGISSVIFSIAALRTVSCQRWTTITAKPFLVLIFGMLYIVLFDVIAIIMTSEYIHEDFVTSIQGNMLESLQDKYGVSSPDFMLHWDQLQRSSECCGALSYEDWFLSVWADEIKTSTNSSYPSLPLSCLYENAPFGSCTALFVSLARPLSNHLPVGNYSLVSSCNPLLISQGTTAFAYSIPCFPLYLRFLVDEMQTLRRIVIGLIATDVTIIIVLASIAFKLPLKHRINIYGEQFDQ